MPVKGSDRNTAPPRGWCDGCRAERGLDGVIGASITQTAPRVPLGKCSDERYPARLWVILIQDTSECPQHGPPSWTVCRSVCELYCSPTRVYYFCHGDGGIGAAPGGRREPMPAARGMAASLKRSSRKSHLGLQNSYERTTGVGIGPIRCGGRPFARPCCRVNLLAANSNGEMRPISDVERTVGDLKTWANPPFRFSSRER